MARLGLRDLPSPPRRYDPANVVECKFESADDARKEDARRARSIRRNPPIERGLAKAARLATRLARTGSYPVSLASSRYWRCFRRKLIAALWRLVHEGRYRVVSTATIIPLGWVKQADHLDSLKPATLLWQLRTDLNRSGGADAKGWAVFVLHGEFESNTKRYVIHAHGVAVDDMVDVVRDLAKLPKYESSKQRHPSDGVAQRARISRELLSNMPSPLTYLAKSFWPAKWLGMITRNGLVYVARERVGRRIPEPYHARWLCWMDRWDWRDMVLLYGVHVGKNGLVAR